MKNFLLTIVATVLMTFASQAADYGVAKTLYSVPVASMADGGTSNVQAVVDCTQVTDFALQVRNVFSTQPSTGFVIVWDTSLDNSSFCSATNVGLGNATGWFTVPTSTTFTNTWVTNITVNAVGYWRLRSITNNAGQTITNISIKAYAKPKRTNRDY